MGQEVCLQCGDKGITNSKVYCINCLEFFVHRYCLGEIPETFDEVVHWICDRCYSLGNHEAPSQASTENMENMKDVKNNVNCVKESENCIQLERVKAKDNQQQKANLLDESLIVEKLKEKRRLVSSTKERERNSSGKESIDTEILKHSKSASESILPNKEARGTEKEVLKQTYQSCSSERPRESDAEPCMANHAISRNGSFKRAWENCTSSDMPCEVKSLSPRNVLSIETGARAILPYIRSNGRESSAKDALISSELDPDACAEPLATPVWRGSFEIRNRNQPALDGLMAHLSSKACEKVADEASMFETVLQLEMVPKSDALPNQFIESPPTGENIALYFFPSNISERAFDNLVEEMRKNEYAMKGRMLNADLLLFTSTELPLAYWRFQSKYYIWGVFKGPKQENP